MDSIIVGLQWGDEGKGKIVQKLSRNHDWIVRFSGGPNAGHTVYHNGVKKIHHLLPSGTDRNFLFISRGTLVDLKVLNDEIDEMSKIYPEIKERIYISPWCRVITSIDKQLDLFLEKIKGSKSVGTTRRGIGPTVSNDANRIGVRIFDLFNPNTASEKIETLASLAGMMIGKIDLMKETDNIFKEFDKIKDNVKDPYVMGSVLFEGTQGIMLDPMYGTYPYVTSTPTLPSAAFYGSGITSGGFEVWGIFKAYTTRVGAGPFPTELLDEDGNDLRKRGDEFGSTTGRPRRCGWLDLPLLKYACRVSSVNHLVITKADVLNGMKKIGVCTSYDHDFLPYDLGKINTKIEYMRGWKDLESSEFADFISIISKILEIKIEYVSSGPMEEDLKKNQ